MNSIQNDIVKKAIQRFPHLPHRTITRYILMENGEYFDGDFERIRTLVRYYSGVRKGSKYPKRDVTVPKTWRIKRTPYNLSPGKWLLLPDVHVPFHEPRAVEAAIQYGKDKNITGVFFPGDLQDCAAVSFWQSSRKRNFDKELEIFIDFLDFIEKEFPTQEKIWLPGNHEYRLPRYYQSKAPELIGMPLQAFDTVLALEQRKITRLEYNQIVMAGKLPIIHGHEFKISTAVNAARGLFLKANSWAACAHYHSTNEHTDKNITGILLTCWSFGCLCDLSPDFSPYGNRWNWGFAIIDVESNGSFSVKNKRILPSFKVA